MKDDFTVGDSNYSLIKGSWEDDNHSWYIVSFSLVAQYPIKREFILNKELLIFPKPNSGI